MTGPELVVDAGCGTGEGPLYHPDRERLYWCDIPTGRVHAYDPASDEHELVFVHPDEPVGGFTLAADGSLLLFCDRGAVRRLDLDTGSAQPVRRADPDRFHARFNDVFADPEGRVFAGVMPGDDRSGALWRFDPDGTATHLFDCGLPNGMGFTPDRSELYFADTGDGPDDRGSVRRYDYDRATGELSNPETPFDVDGIEGSPDGLTVDDEGGVWVAFWRGGRVVRFAPDGTRSRTVEFPPRLTTSIGLDGDGAAYVTTAGGDGRDDTPGAGGLYRFTAGVGDGPSFRSAIGV
jgi:D-xylonolactonase